MFGVLFFYDLLSSWLPFRTQPLNWQAREVLELAGGLGLLLGFAAGFYFLRNLNTQVTDLNARMRVASGAFQKMVLEEFKVWRLSPKEQDIAMFILKGLTNAEICELTGKKEGTVKAQTNAIFRKASVSNRSQFTSHFIEILMQEPLIH